MKTLGKVSLLIGLLLILSACQTNIKNIETTIGQEPLRTNPVDVQREYINTQRITPQALDVSSGNLFDNSGFESGLDGWTGCSAGAIKTSSDAYEGSGALEVVPNNCFYKSAEVSAGDDLILSCYAKITEGSGWTGMGLGFADSNWTTIDVDIPATVITGTDYARYDVKFTAPANSKYASMWLYSENPFVVDNCSLMLEAAPPPPPPPPPSGENLLENPEFLNSSPTGAEEWATGCEGYTTSTYIRNIRYKHSLLANGACMDQSLSASDIDALKGNEFTLSCIAKNTDGYASISIFLDGNPISKVIPVTTGYFTTITIQGNAGDISSGFVSLYAEGTLLVDECGLAVGSQGIKPRPMLEINKRNRFEQYPQNVNAQLINTGNVSLNRVSITSDNLPDCNLSLGSLEIDERYEFSCNGPSLGSRESFDAEVIVTGEYANGTIFTETRTFRLLGFPNAPTTNNYLENGAFEEWTDGDSLNATPLNWNVGCAGNSQRISGRTGQAILLTDGTCIDQILTESDLAQLAGKQYIFSCYVGNRDGYASMSIFFNGVPTSKEILQIGDGAIGSAFVRFSGVVPNDVNSGFVSLYGEGRLAIDSCSLNIDETAIN